MKKREKEGKKKVHEILEKRWRWKWRGGGGGGEDGGGGKGEDGGGGKGGDGGGGEDGGGGDEGGGGDGVLLFFSPLPQKSFSFPGICSFFSPASEKSCGFLEKRSNWSQLGVGKKLSAICHSKKTNYQSQPDGEMCCELVFEDYQN